jgi:ferredoxin
MPALKRVRVDPRLCEAHALCIELAPDVFDLADDIATCDETPDVRRLDDVEAAIAACPRQAIGWVEPQSGHPIISDGRHTKND